MITRCLNISNKTYCKSPTGRCIYPKEYGNCIVCPHLENEEDDVDKVVNILKELIALDGVKEEFYKKHKHDDYIMDLLSRVVGYDIYKDYKEKKNGS